MLKARFSFFRGTWVLLGCSGCAGLTYSDSSPELVHVSVSCGDDGLAITVLAEDDNAVTDVSIEAEGDAVVADTGGDALWLADMNIAYKGGGSEWSAVGSVDDCAADTQLTVTATNTWGRQSSQTVWWPELELEASGLEPPHGTDAGGSVVTVHGEDLGRTEVVWFGDAAAELVSVEPDAVVVTTPPGTAGVVDVVVQASDASETRLSEAFTYHPDATGQYVGLMHSFVHIYSTALFSIGSAYADISYGPFVQAEVLFHDAQDEEDGYFANHPFPGSCEWGTWSWSQTSAGSYVVAASDVLGEHAMLGTDAEAPTYYYVEDSLDYTLWAGESLSIGVVSEVDVPVQTFEDAIVFPVLPGQPDFDFEAVNALTWGEDISLDLDSTASGALITFYPSSGSSPLDALNCAFDPTSPAELSWAELVADVDESAVDGIHMGIAYYEDTLVEAEHNAGLVWSRAYVKYWVYFELEAAGAVR